jgi:citrate lyase subunit beta/citryl-CoA lyase
VTARSYLYVPGDSGERLLRASSRGADAVIADLEDSVAPANRRDAVEAVAAWLAAGGRDADRWVRVTSAADAADQLARLMDGPLDGVVIPKVSSVSEVARVVEVLRALEDSGGCRAPVRVMPLVETARALASVDEIAAHPRVTVLQLGELDLAADLGLVAGADEQELLFARSRVVVASAAAGIEAPVGAVSPDFSDLDALRVTTQRLRRLGFAGRAVIHPRQVAIVNDVFTPSSREVEDARRVLASYEAAVASGSGVFVGQDGRMIDEAVVRMSRRVVALASGGNGGDQPGDELHR